MDTLLNWVVQAALVIAVIVVTGKILNVEAEQTYTVEDILFLVWRKINERGELSPGR